MITKVLTLLGLVALAYSASIPDSAEWSWEQFKLIHGKVYQDKEEEIYRKSIFEENLKDIKEHNKLYLDGLVPYSKEANHLADKHIEEIIGEGFKYDPEEAQNEEVHHLGNVEAPVSYDWRRVPGVVTPVKNQGQCGSCWSFSSTGAIEGQLMLKRGQSVSLSEQQLVDCSRNFGNYGCRGGWMNNAFKYIAYAGGITTENQYPYTARDGYCNFNPASAVATVTGFRNLPSGDEESLKNAVGTIGPIAVAIQSNQNLQLYRGGIFYDPSCSKQMNHAVLAVGYGRDASRNLDYWIIKNSWSASWGEQGYFRMARNYGNMCSISTQASYPTV